MVSNQDTIWATTVTNYAASIHLDRNKLKKNSPINTVQMQKFLEGNITTEGDCRGWFDESLATGHYAKLPATLASGSGIKVRGQSSRLGVKVQG